MFANKINVSSKASNATEVIYDIDAFDKFNRKAHYVVAVPKIKESLFLKDLEKGKIDIRKYAKIIKSYYVKDIL